MSTLRRFFTDEESGQSLVEFALTLPIVLLVITGTFDVARAVWQENTLAYAAREGTRYAIVHGAGYQEPDPPTGDPLDHVAWPSYTEGIRLTVRAAAVGIGGTILVNPTWPENCYQRTCQVAVEATSQFVPLPSYYLLGSAFQITLKGGSQLVIQR
ncbi:MAG TPA: TadE family protein [Candidatus Limnocylindria bacterium]